MRTLVHAFAVALTASVVCLAPALAAPEAQAPTAAFRTVGDFRVAMFTTKNPTEFLAAAKTSLAAMAQASSNKVQIGQTLYAAMMFGGCKASVTKTCLVSAVFRITPPKGKPVVSERVYLWRSAAPDVAAIQLGEQPFAIALDKTDPPGKYDVEVDVLDHNANVTITLKADFVAAR